MRSKFLTIAAAALLLGGCSKEEPAADRSRALAPKQAAAQEQRLAGREAFQKLYIAARNWSPDAQPIAMESRPRSGEAPDGRAAVWSGTFASAGKQAMRSYLWSGAVGEDAPESGISPGSMSSFSPGNASTQPFDPAYLKVDTDKALEVGNKHGGKAALGKDQKSVKFDLRWEPQKARLLWVIGYTTSGKKPGHANIYVNASTGEFLKIEK